LMPHAEDRAEVEAQLAELGANQRA
jgi:hypothetical protein